MNFIKALRTWSKDGSNQWSEFDIRNDLEVYAWFSEIHGIFTKLYAKFIVAPEN